MDNNINEGKENKNNSVNTSKNSVSNSVEELKKKVEEVFNENLEPKDIIKKTIKNEFKNLLSKKEYSFFDSYIEEEDKFEQKFEKYFPMHEDIFFSALNKEIEIAKNDTQESIENKKITGKEKEKILKKSVKNAIKNVIKKYCYIIFIFSEKVILTDLKKFLEMDLNNIAEIHKATNENIKDLEKFEDEVNKSIMLELIEEKEYNFKELAPNGFKTSKRQEKLIIELLEAKKELKELETNKKNKNTDEFDNDIEELKNYIESINLAYDKISESHNEKIIKNILNKESKETRQLINGKFFASMYRQMHIKSLSKNYFICLKLGLNLDSKKMKI
ncbi:hypothetical protein HXK64_01115 [Candidatus Gracilibacteria bacterium]|nr:hypothetical protein [Candidatus Gracilibacteria bacterium]